MNFVASCWFLRICFPYCSYFLVLDCLSQSLRLRRKAPSKPSVLLPLPVGVFVSFIIPLWSRSLPDCCYSSAVEQKQQNRIWLIRLNRRWACMWNRACEYILLWLLTEWNTTLAIYVWRFVLQQKMTRRGKLSQTLQWLHQTITVSGALSDAIASQPSLRQAPAWLRFISAAEFVSFGGCKRV